jgi:ribosomal protein RSM22 (predicted rRNA methylase)
MKGDDWCHFSQRIERTRAHRLLKEGILGFEDEKFSYLVVSRVAVLSCSSRIIRYPQKLSGHVRLSLCTGDGLKEKVIARRDKENYRKARDSEWGESWM